MRRTARITDDFAPLSGMNTTPLIDVMLVLLVMFIITIPLATHKVAVDLPSEKLGPGVPPPVRLLEIDAAGGLAWDGAPVPPAALQPRLAAMLADPAAPVLHLKTDAATRYERFDETLAVIKKAGVTRLGFVGNEAFARAID